MRRLIICLSIAAWTSAASAQQARYLTNDEIVDRYYDKTILP